MQIWKKFYEIIRDKFHETLSELKMFLRRFPEEVEEAPKIFL